MTDLFVFQPARQAGLAFHAATSLVLILAGVAGLWQAAHASIGPVFLLYLLPSLFALGLVPLLAYRAFALQKAQYTLMRDGIRLHWGLRLEDIPMNSVLWVRKASELEQALPMPVLRWPGSVLGNRHLPGSGEVEFLAGDPATLILIATAERVYAVSPEDPDSFLHAFHRFMELGSFNPLPARSVYPSFLLARVWNAPLARSLLLSGLGLSLVLLVWVSLAIPSRSQIFLGFDPNGNPRDQVPPVRLLLLPVLNSLIFLADFVLGLFFFRLEKNQLLAYLLWTGGALTPLLFLISVIFILQAR